MSTTACDDQLVTHPDDIEVVQVKLNVLDVNSNPIYDAVTDKVLEVGQRVIVSKSDTGVFLNGVIVKINGSSNKLKPIVVNVNVGLGDPITVDYNWSEVTAI